MPAFFQLSLGFRADYIFVLLAVLSPLLAIIHIETLTIIYTNTRGLSTGRKWLYPVVLSLPYVYSIHRTATLISSISARNVSYTTTLIHTVAWLVIAFHVFALFYYMFGVGKAANRMIGKTLVPLMVRDDYSEPIQDFVYSAFAEDFVIVDTYGNIISNPDKTPLKGHDDIYEASARLINRFLEYKDDVYVNSVIEELYAQGERIERTAFFLALMEDDEKYRFLTVNRLKEHEDVLNVVREMYDAVAKELVQVQSLSEDWSDARLNPVGERIQSEIIDLKQSIYSSEDH